MTALFVQISKTRTTPLPLILGGGGNYEIICFLDLKISVSCNKLMTTVYSKPTDSHLYLHSTSCHKSSSINSIQKGVALRLRRICSMTEEYQNKAKQYSSYLAARGHDLKTVKSRFNKIKKVLSSVV